MRLAQEIEMVEWMLYILDDGIFEWDRHQPIRSSMGIANRGVAV